MKVSKNWHLRNKRFLVLPPSWTLASGDQCFVSLADDLCPIDVLEASHDALGPKPPHPLSLHNTSNLSLLSTKCTTIRFPSDFRAPMRRFGAGGWFPLAGFGGGGSGTSIDIDIRQLKSPQQHHRTTRRRKKRGGGGGGTQGDTKGHEHFDRDRLAWWAGYNSLTEPQKYISILW